MKLKKSAFTKLINFIIFISTIILFFIFEKEEMYQNLLGDSEGYSAVLLNPTLLLLNILLIIYCIYGRWSGNKLFLLLFILEIYNMFIASIWGPKENASVLKTVIFVMRVIMPFLLCHFMYNATLRISKRFILVTLGVTIALLALFYMQAFTHIMRYLLLEDYRGGGTYLFLMMLPFAMLFPNKWIRIFYIFAMLLIILSSMKRGAALSALLGLFAYYIVNTIVNGKGLTTKKIIVIVSGLFVIIVGFIVFDTMTGGIIIERFANISEDGGSNRNVIYPVVISMIEESDVFNIMLGHGWNSVLADSPFQISAHNDYLELLYDCGIFSFFIFIVLVLYSWRYAFLLIKAKKSTAAAFSACCVIFLINSMVSHIHLYTWYFSAICLFWGYCIGIERKEWPNKELLTRESLVESSSFR